MTEGPAPGSFSLMPAVTPLRAKLPLVAPRPAEAGLVWLGAPIPLGLQPLPCPGLLGDQPGQLLRLPAPDKVRGNRAVRAWASRFTSSCLGFFICKMEMITAQSSQDCWEC